MGNKNFNIDINIEVKYLPIEPSYGTLDKIRDQYIQNKLNVEMRKLIKSFEHYAEQLVIEWTNEKN
jgi:hypothetical protein